ncbi:hypothetical protein PI95_015640 [Hassallia byssoidea VB512170]|uniref:Uncharacterized protein n=1 Tax=Hassallia byssoidea VB512170 TaxID=1304833 RepID=A0A846HBK4_9CYAN|nr:hypothetical protein [Hassalia byssoidea]NEU73950.1 hypothetical protein [Hassalia byssoidea VB512170]
MDSGNLKRGQGGQATLGLGTGKRIITNAQCPMPNSQCPLITNYKKTRTSRGVRSLA